MLVLEAVDVGKASKVVTAISDDASWFVVVASGISSVELVLTSTYVVESVVWGLASVD